MPLYHFHLSREDPAAPLRQGKHFMPFGFWRLKKMKPDYSSLFFLLFSFFKMACLFIVVQVRMSSRDTCIWTLGPYSRLLGDVLEVCLAGRSNCCGQVSLTVYSLLCACDWDELSAFSSSHHFCLLPCFSVKMGTQLYGTLSPNPLFSKLPWL